MNKNQKLVKQLDLMNRKDYQALNSAEVLLREKDFGAVSSKSYYAIFHMLQAALLTKKMSFSKHSGVISAFSRHFIKEKIFPEEFIKDIQRLWKHREIGDYDYLTVIDPEEATEDFEIAKRIVKAIESYLIEFKRKS